MLHLNSGTQELRLGCGVHMVINISRVHGTNLVYAHVSKLSFGVHTFNIQV